MLYTAYNRSKKVSFCIKEMCVHFMSTEIMPLFCIFSMYLANLVYIFSTQDKSKDVKKEARVHPRFYAVCNRAVCHFRNSNWPMLVIGTFKMNLTESIWQTRSVVSNRRGEKLFRRTWTHRPLVYTMWLGGYRRILFVWNTVLIPFILFKIYMMATEINFYDVNINHNGVHSPDLFRGTFHRVYCKLAICLQNGIK